MEIRYNPYCRVWCGDTDWAWTIYLLWRSWDVFEWFNE
jgi:hypothetical protein